MNIGRRTFLHSALAATGSAIFPMRRLPAETSGSSALPSLVNARTLSRRELSLRGSDIHDFGKGLRGELILPGDAGYDVARRLWNAAFDRHPALIARCAGAGDVVRAVQFARSHALLTAVRGGGHSYTGESGCDGGLVIDLSAMKGLRVNPEHRTAEAQPGIRLGEFDRETQAFGLATTLGTAPDTGLAGLTLGGGFGRLDRQFGLACDNLRSVDIVTADGILRHASADENPDLFWGVRGGGGNFGVVTNFEYQLHPLGPLVLEGSRIFPFTAARRVMTAVLELSQTIPDEMLLFTFVMRSDRLPPPGIAVGYSAVYAGAPGKGEKLLEPLRTLGKPLGDTIAAKSYVAAQGGTADWCGPAGCTNTYSVYSKTGFMPGVSSGLVDEIVRRFESAPSFVDLIVIFREGGEFGRVKPDATAFWNRWSQYALTLQARWIGREQSAHHLEEARSVWSVLAPFTRNYYINVDDARGAQQVRETYGGNYRRLVRLKNKYDPTNLFRLNANIEPTASV